MGQVLAMVKHASAQQYNQSAEVLRTWVDQTIKKLDRYIRHDAAYPLYERGT